MTNGNDILEHTENCNNCIDIQNIIDVLETNKDKTIQQLIDDLYQEQQDCYDDNTYLREEDNNQFESKEILTD